MKTKIWLTIALILGSINSYANINNYDLVTPRFNSTSFFKNPAELVLYDNLIGGNCNYSAEDKNFLTSCLLHIPDFSLGDFGISVELSGNSLSKTDFLQDFSNLKTKYNLTWAKKTDFLVIGLNATKTQDLTTQSLGFDAGLFFTPFKDLYIGYYVNNCGDTYVYNKDSTISNSIPESSKITCSAISGKDMGISIGIESDDLANSKDLTTALKNSYILGRKVFGNVLLTQAEYNKGELVYTIGFKLNDYLTFSGKGSRQFTDMNSIFQVKKYEISLSYGITFNAINDIRKHYGYDNYFSRY
jgi:hypothetical protein